MRTVNRVATADKLIELRKANGYTQVQLAEELFIARNSVAKWEQMVCLPTIDMIARLTELYHCTFNDILITEDN